MNLWEDETAKSSTYSSDRLISFGADCAAIPERLLLAHARGQVLFITGAGTSAASNLPDFRGLVVQTYERIDVATHAVLQKIPRTLPAQFQIDYTGLTPQQSAEVRRFIGADYDVVLGMLERRMDGVGGRSSTVRKAIDQLLREGAGKPAGIHKSLMRLADRGGATTIVTTNFDLLLEAAIRPRVKTYALDAIPRPSHRMEFAGVFHIHGALDTDPTRLADFIVSDQDFGEFYLRRRAIPDFIYDAARLFHIVLVGYSANDPPMRYLLNAVAADGSRFDDLKERFTFIGGSHPPDPITIEDWKGRGITPIAYDGSDNHVALGRTLERWAALSANNGKPAIVDAEIRRIVRTGRVESSDSDRDLFDHLVRRSDPNERVRLARLSSSHGADFGWLEAISAIAREPV